ncbi:uncharacterized protein LOC106088028 isoform X1 [Stomoxys calcitrans]|uniref:Uncharacterized protein n=1 Tax=Stomoxys calcitrans TaxID=35570 RepID=A0A1I8PL78_STOCA|nr:uncharacterized protein LOC106088028 isoform X1 [Stomoxys calcitrans]
MLFKRFGMGLTLLLAVLYLRPTPSTALIEDVLDVLHVVKEVTTAVLKAWDVVKITTSNSDIDFPLMRDKQKKVLSRLREVSSQIIKTEDQHSEHIAAAIDSVNNFVESNLQLLAKRNEIADTMNRITSRFQQMQQYEQFEQKLETETLLKFAEWTVAPNAYSVHHLMDRLHLMMFGPDDKAALGSSGTNILEMMANSYEASKEERCLNQQSTQQFLYSLYTDIALTELKGYTMMEFSWMILRVYGKGNFTQEAELMRKDFEKRTDKTVRLLRDVMKRADRIVWRCDPDKYVLGQNYDEVTRLLQGYIENEVDMNYNRECWSTCEDYTSTKNEGCFKDKFCARQERCSGNIHSCRRFDSDMFICQSPRDSPKRYEFIEYENGVTLGKVGQCSRGKTSVDSWWRYLFWHCTYCFCLCDDQYSSKTDRYFNLRETLSNVNENKVLTGLRFAKVNRVFHLQIQEGVLLPRGKVNESSLNWVPIDNYTLNARNVRNNRDYYTLSYGARSIDLDDVHTDDHSFVVTGVRFRVVGAHLNLEARLSEFNFETGKLVNPQENSFWKSNDNTDVSGDRRQKVELSSPDVPIRTKAKSVPDSRHNQYIEFTASDVYKDASQSTVPFIDTQYVISTPPVPLAGIGIYHKGRPGYGGFIAPKLMTYDFAPHIQPPRRN